MIVCVDLPPVQDVPCLSPKVIWDMFPFTSDLIEGNCDWILDVWTVNFL